MSEIIKQWIQDMLGVIINITPETFCELTRDGLLLCRILRHYEVITEEQLKMIEKSSVKSVCFKNFHEHIIHWLRRIRINLSEQDVKDIVGCQGLASLSLFYRVFLELHQKDALAFLAERRLNEKLRPDLQRFTVEKVHHKEPEKYIDSTYKKNLENSFNVVHWLQDRLEMVVNKCKSAREEYLHVMRARDKSNAEESIPTGGILFDEVSPELPNVSARTNDMTVEDLIKESLNFRRAQKFLPDLNANEILGKIKNKLKMKAEKMIFMKEIQNHVMQKFFQKLIDEECADINKDIAEKILQQSFYEQQMQHKLRTIKHQKESMLQSKQVLTEQIAKEKEKEFVDKLMQKQIILHKNEFEYYLEKQRALHLHRSIYKEKLRLKAEKMFNLCEETIKGICNVAIKVTEYKGFFGEPPSPKVLNNWKERIQEKEVTQDVAPHIEDIISPEPKVNESLILDEITRQNIMDEKDLETYEAFQWPWVLQDFSEEEISDMNNGMNVLGYIVHEILKMKYPPPCLPDPPDLPKVEVRVCVNGLPELSCLKVLQKILTRSKILVIELQDVVNYCLDEYKKEVKEENDEDTGKTEEVRSLKRKGIRGMMAKSTIDNVIDTSTCSKSVQTPKYYPGQEIVLSPAAELGKIAFSQLTLGYSLTDFLLISMFITYIKDNHESMKGWVLINFPTTYEQAIMFEESLSGLQVPGVENREKMNKSLADIMYFEYQGDQQRESRHSRLLPNPKQSQEPLAYDTILTAFINVKQMDPSSPDYDVPRETTELGDAAKLQQFYMDQGCCYTLYYETFEYHTIKHLARLIIGDFSLPPKSSVELFGDIIKYLDMEKDDQTGIQSVVRHSEKKETERIERIPRKSSVDSPKATSMVKEPPKRAYSMIIRQDKSTQIPEVKVIEVDPIEPPKAGEAGWSFDILQISDEIGLVLADIWEKVEEIYINDLGQIFFEKRYLMDILMPYIDFAKKIIRAYIKKSDQRQLYLRDFQTKFNQFDADYRHDKEFKAQLHCLVRELKDKFMSMADLRMMRAERERKDVIKENWGPRHLIQLINNYINAFQIELDRNNDTLGFINDYFTGIITQVPYEEIVEKDILNKIPLESPDIEQELNNIFLNTNSTDNNPLLNKIEAAYQKIEAVAEKYETLAIADADKVKTLYKTGVTRKSMSPKANVKGGLLFIFQPTEKVKQNAQAIFENWDAALRGEISRINIRLKLLKKDLIYTVDIAFNALKNAYHSLFEENKQRYEAEEHSIKEVCYAISRAIYEGNPIQEELVLFSDKMQIKKEHLLFPDMLDRQMIPTEGTVFYIDQLEVIRDIFHDLGPDGFVPERAFTFVLQDLVTDTDRDLVPFEWKRLGDLYVTKLSQEMFGNQTIVCWKDFILFNLLVPFPTIKEIIQMRQRFLEYDTQRTERIKYDNFMEIRFWFEIADIDDEAVKKLLFKMYQVNETSMNYTAMLFDFCKSDGSSVGIAKALSLISGKPICWDRSVGKTYIMKTLEERVQERENKRIRNIEMKENTKFARTIIDDLIDKTVKTCDSLIITEIDNEDKKSISIGEEETTSKSEEKINNKHESVGSDQSANQLLFFETVETSHETKKTEFEHFLNLEHMCVVLSRTFNWREINANNIKYYDYLKNIYEELKNSSFGNKVFTHEFLYHPNVLKIFDGTKKFRVALPHVLVKKFLEELMEIGL